MWGRVRVGGGGDSAICLEGAHKPGERERECTIPHRWLYHVTSQALKSRPTCLVDVQVITRHRRSQRRRIPGLSAQQQIPTAPQHKLGSTQGACLVVVAAYKNTVVCSDHIYMTQTLQNKYKDLTQIRPVSTQLTQWAAAVLQDQSSLRKNWSLVCWTKGRTREVPSQLFKTVRAQPAAQATQRKARPRSAIDPSAQKLEEWLPMSVSENASWTTTRPSMPCVLL